jgi:tRNA pseudouridine38-40 synthase
MPRYRLLIEYDGTGYAGWQRQPDQRSIQSSIEAAIFAFSGERKEVRGAGRTDAGVHALGQVGHVDLMKDWRPDVVRDALNAHLRSQRETIAILDAMRVKDEFDARISALKRHYIYRILDRRPPATLDQFRVWQIPKQLDLAAMMDGARHLLGRHDFTTFRASECQAKSPVRTLDQLDVVRRDTTIEMHVSARSFLHHQVRSMAGSLVEVGLGKWQPDDMKKRLDARDRTLCGPQAPACGLYFARVDYPENS